MNSPCWQAVAVLLVAGALGGCATSKEAPSAKSPAKTAPSVEIRPGPNVQEELQTALIKAKPGELIALGEGLFEFTNELSLAVENVTIRGKGVDKTILSFKKQDTGKHGLLVTRGQFLIEDLTVEDTRGDGLKVNDVKDVVFRHVRARWSGEAKESNGAYGFYPVQCENVLIENCEAIGASDAGIYVGQSKNVIVRRCRASQNVAGIEIENCTDADVYENTATNNAGGLLVFDLPGLQAKNGRRIRVHDNQIISNNHVNFAPKGNTVASVAPGTGAMIMATDQVEFFHNTLKDNHTYGLSIISFTNPGKEVTDAKYDAYPEGIFVHDNTFVNCGTEPTGDLAQALAAILGKPLPEIIYDGAQDSAKFIDKKLPRELGVFVKNNGSARFANLQMNVLSLVQILKSGKLPSIDRNIKAYEGDLPPLSAVKLPGVD